MCITACHWAFRAAVHYFCGNRELLPRLISWYGISRSFSETGLVAKTFFPATTSWGSIDCGFSPPALLLFWVILLTTLNSNFLILEDWRKGGTWSKLMKLSKVTTSWQNQGPNPRPLIEFSCIFHYIRNDNQGLQRAECILSKVIQDRKSLVKKATEFYFIIQDNWSSWPLQGCFLQAFHP